MDDTQWIWVSFFKYPMSPSTLCVLKPRLLLSAQSIFLPDVGLIVLITGEKDLRSSKPSILETQSRNNKGRLKRHTIQPLFRQPLQ